MPVKELIRVQVGLVLDNLKGSAVYPPLDQWDQIDDFDYLYREYAILTREQDADRVESAVIRIMHEAGYGDVFEGQGREVRRERVSAGVICLMVPETPMPVKTCEPGLRQDMRARACPSSSWTPV
jgi:hypothetical protein